MSVYGRCRKVNSQITPTSCGDSVVAGYRSNGISIYGYLMYYLKLDQSNEIESCEPPSFVNSLRFNHDWNPGADSSAIRGQYASL